MHSTEEYQKAVKLLKVKLLTLKEQQQKLIESLREKIKEALYTGEIHIKPSITVPESLLGFTPYENEYYLRQLLNILQPRGISLEMLYRCADAEQNQSVSLEQFRGLLLQVESGLTEADAQHVCNIFDEDCNGSLAWEEYKTVLVRYAVNTEGQYVLDCHKAENELYLRVWNAVQDKRLSAEQIFYKIDRTQTKQLQKFFEDNGLQLKDQELFTLLRTMDFQRSTKLRQRAFVREMGYVKRSALQAGQADPEDEMARFRECFTIQGLSPLQVFKLADKGARGSVAVAQLRDTILDLLAPAVRAAVQPPAKNAQEQLDLWLKLIDSNSSGQITSEDIELSIIGEKELHKLVKLANKLTPEQQGDILARLQKKVKDESFLPEELFMRMNRTRTGQISLIELRSGLLELGYNLSETVRLMRVFDKNLDGGVQINEFIETLTGQKGVYKIEGVIQNKQAARVLEDEDEDEEVGKVLEELLARIEQALKKTYASQNMTTSHATLFREADIDADGVLSQYEFMRAVTNILSMSANGGEQQASTVAKKVYLTETQKRLLLQYADLNHDGDVDYREFQVFLGTFGLKNLQEQKAPSTLLQKSVLLNKQPASQNKKEVEKKPAQNKPAPAPTAAPDAVKEAQDDDDDDGGDLFGQQDVEKGVQAAQAQEGQQNKSSQPQAQKSTNQGSQLDSQAEIRAFVITDDKKSSQDEYAVLYRQLAVERELYTDSSGFPANVKSLTKDQNRFPVAKECTWTRASELYDVKNCTVFRDSLLPSSVQQGRLGDCYLLAAVIALLQKNPELIKRLFDKKVATEQACYAIWLCVDAQWRQVLLDDYLPCTKDTKNLLFSHTPQNEIWLPLLEKAYAKSFGSYENIEKGYTAWALRDLTGAPAQFIVLNSDSAQRAWDFILQNLKSKYIVTAASRAADTGAQSLGIVPSHAYAVLDAREIKNKDAKLEKIVRLRNPLPIGSIWEGPYSAKSDRWTDQLKKDLVFDSTIASAADTPFWMPLQDFCTEFSDLAVNLLHDDYYYRSLRLPDDQSSAAPSLIQGKRSYFLYTFTIDSKLHAFFSISQYDARHTTFANPSYQYAVVQLVLSQNLPVQKADGNAQTQVKYIASDFGTQRDQSIEGLLEAGQYQLYVEVEWQKNSQQGNPLILSYYGSAKNFTLNADCLKPPIDAQSADKIVTQLILSKGAPGVQSQITTYHDGTREVPEIKSWVDKMAGYVSFVFQNDSEEATLKETFTSKQLVGLKICPPYSDDHVFKVKVLPKEKQVVRYAIDPAVPAYTYSFDRTPEISVVLDDDKLVQQAKSSPDSQIEHRSGLGVTVYKYQYNDGVIVVWVNTMQKENYYEEDQFTVENLKGVDFDVAEVQLIRVYPGIDKFIKFQIINRTLAVKLGVSCSYWTEQATDQGATE